MNNLHQWAKAHDIPPAAMAALFAMFQVDEPTPGAAKTPEGDVQNLVRMEASRKGLRLWRNNNGACYDNTGRFIRYGLANDSKKMNDAIKSSDLIGIRPVTITPEHVGTVIGQFVAREIKAGGWKYRDSGREKAQGKFLQLVASLGGDASFANREGTL